MAQVLVEEQSLSDTAAAIRSRLGGQDTYKPREFAAAINSIVDYATVTQTLTGASSSTNATKVAKGDSFYAEITPTASDYKITSITVTMGGMDITSQVFKPGVGAKVITANGTYTAAEDNLSGYDTVIVAVPTGGGGPTYEIVVPEQTINATGAYTQITVFTENLIEGETYRITLDGTEYTDTAINLYGSLGVGYTISGGAWTFDNNGNDMYFDILNSSLYGTHVIKLEKQTSSGGGGGENLQTKSVSYTPTTSTQTETVTADTGYDGLQSVGVTVDPIPSSYITPTGTKQISITQNGTTTEDVTSYASAEITVSVPSVSWSALSYPVIIQTTRSGSVAINRAHYKSNTIIGFARSNVTKTAPLTLQNMLTDGTHIFLNASAGSTITYNGENATFVKDGQDFMITIPDGFDGTIPFVVS